MSLSPQCCDRDTSKSAADAVSSVGCLPALLHRSDKGQRSRGGERTEARSLWSQLERKAVVSMKMRFMEEICVSAGTVHLHSNGTSCV